MPIIAEANTIKSGHSVKLASSGLFCSSLFFGKDDTYDIVFEDSVNALTYHNRHIVISGNMKIRYYDTDKKQDVVIDHLNDTIFPDDTVNMSNVSFTASSSDTELVTISTTSWLYNLANPYRFNIEISQVRHSVDTLNIAVDYKLKKGNLYYINVPYIVNGYSRKAMTLVACEYEDSFITPMGDGKIFRIFERRVPDNKLNYDQETGLIS
jgi:hypothetical protein